MLNTDIPNPVKILKNKIDKPAKDDDKKGMCMKDMNEKQIIEGLPKFLH